MEPSSPRNMADPNGRNSGYETDLYTRLLSDGADQDDGELSDDPANDIMVQVVPSSSSYSPRERVLPASNHFEAHSDSEAGPSCGRAARVSELHKFFGGSVCEVGEASEAQDVQGSAARNISGRGFHEEAGKAPESAARAAALPIGDRARKFLLNCSKDQKWAGWGQTVHMNRRTIPSQGAGSGGGGEGGAPSSSSTSRQLGPSSRATSRAIAKAMPLGAAAAAATIQAARARPNTNVRRTDQRRGGAEAGASREVGARTRRPVQLPDFKPGESPYALDDLDLCLMAHPESGAQSGDGGGGADELFANRRTHHLPLPALEDLMPRNVDIRSRVSVFCTAEKFRNEHLLEKIRSADPMTTLGSLVTNIDTLAWDDDVVHVRCHGTSASPEPIHKFKDIFFFEWGVTVLWGFERDWEKKIVSNILPAVTMGRFNDGDVEDDEYTVLYSAQETPKIANDTITMGLAMMKNAQVKKAISYALGQSTKLSIFEERISTHTEEAVELPKMLADTGNITINRKEISKLIGRVFLEKCAVNLLGNVLDTPEFFWNAPDSLQSLYDAVCEYLEMEDRVQVLNARFEVLHSMLDMLRDHQNNEHSTNLEWIVIILILVEIIVGVVEILGVVMYKGG